MTVFFDKARKRWRFDFQLRGIRHARECLAPNGDPVTCKRAALESEAEARRLAASSLELSPFAELTLAQIMNDLTEIWQHQTGWADRKRMVREILAFFGHATPIRAIDGARIQDYIAFAQTQPLRVWKGGPSKHGRNDCWSPHPAGTTRGAATVNRYLPVLRAAFKRAYLTRHPVTRERAIEDIPVIEDLPELKRKARPAPDDVLVDLMDVLPVHVIEALKLTLLFGFRRSEAFSLKLSQVDFQGGGIRLDAQHVKDREDAFLPGSSHAMQLLAQLSDQARTRKTQFLITWRGRVTRESKLATAVWKPIKSPKTAWGTAMKVIEEKYGRRWRWHDVRAAFITQVAMTCGAVAAQKMARHSDFKTTSSYIEVADAVMRSAAESASERPALGRVQAKRS
jgi:integrase